jgi:hypothetical protein
VESLEDRTVPTYFGTSGGESIAVGPVLEVAGTVNYPNDIITGTGPGVPALVRIANTSNQLLQAFYPFGTSFKGGVYVATGDVTGDGQTDLIVSSGVGTVGTVKVYEAINGGLQQIASFHPFGSTYAAGVDIASGNVTGELVTAGNTGAVDQVVVGMAHGGSAVKVYGYDDSTGTPGMYLLRSFTAYAPGYTGGVTLAVADIDSQVNTATDPYNHNYASIITGMATTLPEVAIWDAQGSTVSLRAEYMAFNTMIAANRTGINVAAGETDELRGGQIYVNLRGTGTIEVFQGESSAILATLSTYPPQYGTMVNMAVGGVAPTDNTSPTEDDEAAGTYYVRDLVVVAGNISVAQTPVYFSGALFSPAGLNGSKAV